MHYLGKMNDLRHICLPVLLSLMSTLSIAQGKGAKEPGSELPTLNQSVVDYVLVQEGKRVGSGECWDLAAIALNKAGAKWDGMYVFGRLIDWRRDEVLPGDIIQMEEVEVEHRSENMIQREHYGKHTAVVVAVRERGDFTLAHQNVQPLGRKVGLSDLRMSNVRGGKLTFYRPQE